MEIVKDKEYRYRNRAAALGWRIEDVEEGGKTQMQLHAGPVFVRAATRGLPMPQGFHEEELMCRIGLDGNVGADGIFQALAFALGCESVTIETKKVAGRLQEEIRFSYNGETYTSIAPNGVKREANFLRILNILECVVYACKAEEFVL